MPDDASNPDPHLSADSDSDRLIDEHLPEPTPTDDLTAISSSPPIDSHSSFKGLKPFDLGRALVGHQIGDVLLEEFVGGGGMGAVLRGRDVVLHRTVAVKVLATHQASDEETAKRFHMEARSAAQLDHPCIARVHYVGEDRGLRYIIFEYIQGINVRDLVSKQGPLSIADTLSYSLQISDALTHAWQRSVVHRDIKPSNILITEDGQAKLVDMGLARMHEVETSSSTPAEDDLTATGMTIGTFDYIAPEQARNPRDADARSDIYSLGCTMFYMLTGQPPFPGGTPLQKLLSHQGDQPPMLEALRSEVPSPLAAVVGRMLAKRPEQRYQNPADLTTALLDLSDQLGVVRPGLATTIVPTIPYKSTRIERNLPWIAPVATLLVGVGLLSIFWHPREPATNLDAAPLVTREAPEESTNQVP